MKIRILLLALMLFGAGSAITETYTPVDKDPINQEIRAKREQALKEEEKLRKAVVEKRKADLKAEEKAKQVAIKAEEKAKQYAIEAQKKWDAEAPLRAEQEKARMKEHEELVEARVRRMQEEAEARLIREKEKENEQKEALAWLEKERIERENRVREEEASMARAGRIKTIKTIGPPLIIALVMAVWVFFDARNREMGQPKLWAIGTFLMMILVVPFYLARRPLKVGEVREGGTSWNVLKSFAVFWTLLMFALGISGWAAGSILVTNTESDLEKVGGIIGTAIAMKMILELWFVVLAGTLALGFFLKKSSIIEIGPTSGLATSALTTIGRMPSAPSMPIPHSISYDDEFEERWLNLVKFDERIQSAIAQLQPFGNEAIDELKRAFHAITDFSQLPKITEKIVQESHAKKAVEEAVQMVADLVAKEKNSAKLIKQEEAISEVKQEGTSHNHQDSLDAKHTLKKSLYQSLGVQENSSQQSIDDAYTELLNKLQAHDHEDTSVELFCIRNAHDILSNPEKRAAYDEKLTRDFEERLAAKLENMPLPTIQIGGLAVHQRDNEPYDFYKILGVSSKESLAEVEAAYKVQLEKYQNLPLGGHENSATIIKIINTSYSILSDPASKSIYDKMLQFGRIE